MPSITLYTTPYCGFCRRAKSLLSARELPFEEVDISAKPELRQQLSQQTGMRTVPMIFIGDECIGGSDELHALDASGELKRRMSAPTAAP